MLNRDFQIVAVLVCAAFPVVTQGADEKPSDVIKSLLDTQVACWNKKDLDGFLSPYWHDPGVVFQSGGTRSDGFEAIRTRYRNRYQGEGREMGRLEFEGVEVIGLSLDAAVARGRWKLTMADGKTSGGLFTLILRKLPEGWRIVHDHTSSNESLAPAPLRNVGKPTPSKSVALKILV